MACSRLLENGGHRLLENGGLRLLEICVEAVGGVSDTTDPIFYDWWRKRAAEQKTKEQVEKIIDAAMPTLPRKPAVLSAATLTGIEQADSIDDIRRLSTALDGVEAALLHDLIAAYERERDEEETMELLLLA